MRKRTGIAFILMFLLAVGVVLGYRIYHTILYFREIPILGPDAKELVVCVEPDDNATRAAANYLSLAVERSLGKEVRVMGEEKTDQPCLHIRCGAEIPDPEKQAIIEFITVAEAADMGENEDYSIRLEENRVCIYVTDRENCFGAVKAVADRWLKKDCGLKKEAELVISRAMIDRQLSDLPTTVTGTIRILSQNLRNMNDDGGNTIKERSPRFFQLVEDYQPDLIGTQECTLEWLQVLQVELSDYYEIFGCSRDGPNSKTGDWNAILYRKDRFTLQDGETFWLSNTPSEPASKLNYKGSVRICTWALFQDSVTGNTLLFGNTHLSNGRPDPYPNVRAQQMEVLLWQLRKDNKLEEYPGFLTGDFNGEPDEVLYSLATEVYEDSRLSAITNSSTVDYTFHGYGQTDKYQYLFDHCFHSPKNVTVLDYQILDNQYDGFISDHYGVLVTAVIN